MIIWKGKGISVLVSFFAVFIILAILKLDFEICAVAGFFSAAIFSWYFGKKWNNGENREFIDKKTGRHVILKPDHSLFFIKVEYWFFISAILGIITLFTISPIGGAIATALFIITLIIIFLKKRESESLSTIRKVRDLEFEKSRKTDKTFVETVIEQKETDEERKKRRLEKEDPSRFMPK